MTTVDDSQQPIVRLATEADIDNTLKLHFRYQIDSIRDEDKDDGFVTTPFTAEQMRGLIAENGLTIAVDATGNVVGYAMAASWNFWSTWPMFAYMITKLPEITYKNIQLSRTNSYQYGPICIDKQLRGRGLLQQLFEFAMQQMRERYDVLVTFVNKNNPRSYAAHREKLNLDVLNEFEYNDNQYYEMGCLTALQ